MGKHYLGIDPATVKGPFCLTQRHLHNVVGVVTVEKYALASQIKKELDATRETVRDVGTTDPELN